MSNISNQCAKCKRPALVLLAVAFMAVVSFNTVCADDPSASKKTMRQIGVMEKIIDQILIDSPNFLVSGGDNTRGLYIDQFGAVFGFEASLVSQWFDFGDIFSGLKDRISIDTNEDGDQVVTIRKFGKDGKEEEVVIEKEKGRTEEEIYNDGKEEMVQTMLDYGETMSSLRDGQWVVIAAFLKGADYFKERQISRLILKAKIDDLRAYSAGRLSESAARSRVLIEEY